MGKIKITKKEYKGWKNSIEMTNGAIDLIATTDIGPRIIRFGFSGGENEFFENKEQIGKVNGKEWNIYGGHRLWHSPEEMPRTYELDNSPVEYEIDDDTLILSQAVEPWTMIKKDMEITMDEESNEVTVTHRLTNKGAWPIELSIWGITVMAQGGTEIVPEITVDTGLLPNRLMSLWPYTKLNDPRVKWGEKYILLTQDPKCEPPFKIGLPNMDGWAAYANHGNLFIKKYDHFDGEMYPDYGSSYETYTNGMILEMESLSPLSVLSTDESIVSIERWSLHKGVMVPANEKDVIKNILPLI